jgi:hypothetical protein
MKQIKLLQMAAVASLLMFGACKKSDSTSISKPPLQIGQAVSDATPLTGSIKGTMLSGKTYTISGDVTVNAGDTLLLQSGVTVNVTGPYNIFVKGTFISLGTSSAPNSISVSGVTKTDNPSATLATDPAFSGKWCGINCDTTCAMFVMKWTHVEFCGATLSSSISFNGLTPSTASFAIYFQRVGGTFVLEDSWIYGSVDDAVHVASGNISIMRNTFEKCGSNTGECVNLKAGTLGDVAYNLFVGGATNAIKASDAGATTNTPEENTYSYNNTIIDGGYRQSTPAGHGGSVNYEKSGAGKVYNNFFVNCRIGLRIVNTADTNNITYSNNYFYGDSLSLVNEFYAAQDDAVTKPQSTDIPATATWLANPASVVSANNPMFKTFTLPNYNYINVDYASGFDFHLLASSPAIGKGTSTGLSPMALIKVDPTYGPSEITPPGSDIGAYQSNGTGNQH